MRNFTASGCAGSDLCSMIWSGWTIQISGSLTTPRMPSTWALALVGAARPVRSKVLGALEPGAADDLRRRITAVGPFRLDDAEIAQAELADRLRRLHDHGQLDSPRPERSGGDPCLNSLILKTLPSSTVATSAPSFGQVTAGPGSRRPRRNFARPPPPVLGQAPRQHVAAKLEAEINGHGPVGFLAVQTRAADSLVDASVPAQSRQPGCFRRPRRPRRHGGLIANGALASA